MATTTTPLPATARISDSVIAGRVGRNEADPTDGGFTPWQRYSVETYLDYHGAKLARRFDANSYLYINRAMDLHDIGRGRGGLERALARVSAPVLTMGITSDVLYPLRQQEQLHDTINAVGGSSRLALIDSDEGHDAFLIALDQMADAVTPFLDEIGRTR